MSNAAFWDRAAPKYAKDPISDPAAYAATLQRMREILQPAHRVLELGCGTGSTALELAGGVDQYLGTDVSPQMIAIAQAKPSDAPQPSFAVQPADQLPRGPFDVVLALNLLHLLPDLEAVVARIFDALPAGGLFIAKTGLLKDGAWFLPWIIPVMRAVGKAPYVRNLSQPEMLGILRAAGFTVEETVLQPGMAPRLFTVATKP